MSSAVLLIPRHGRPVHTSPRNSWCIALTSFGCSILYLPIPLGSIHTSGGAVKARLALDSRWLFDGLCFFSVTFFHLQVPPQPPQWDRPIMVAFTPTLVHMYSTAQLSLIPTQSMSTQYVLKSLSLKFTLKFIAQVTANQPQGGGPPSSRQPQPSVSARLIKTPTLMEVLPTHEGTPLITRSTLPASL